MLLCSGQIVYLKSDFSAFFLANLFFLGSYHNKEGEENTLFVNHVTIHNQF